MFVWVLQGKAADTAAISRQLGQWTNQFGGTPGYLGATGGVTSDDRFLLFVRWESEDAGNELLMQPAKQDWYEAFQQSFDGAIDFAETDDVHTFLAGGSDTAGFVQGMKVAGVDRALVDAADREFEPIAADVRPDLIGGVRVWLTADGYVELNYFTSEEAARHGEQQALPADIAEGLADFLAMMASAEFFDLAEPFIHSGTGG